MNPLLITGFGTNINVDKRRLIIDNRLENKHYEFYPHQIPHDTIVLDGHSGNISFDALRWLIKHDISLAMLNWNGNLLSVALPKEPASAKLKIKQYEAYLNKQRKNNIAEIIVKQKIIGSTKLLDEMLKYYSFVKPISSKDIENLKNIENLMTYEARIAILYWNNLTSIFNELHPEFRFMNRRSSKHSWNMNASDEINALLNYGYAILETEVRKDLNFVGFDLSIGFLHELKDGRSSLVYDIQELYRWLIDLSVIQLLEERKLKKSDFIITENYNLRLREATAKLLIEKIRWNFNTKVLYNGKYHSYQNILYENVRLLANYITGKSNALKFYIPEFKIDREDNTGLRNKILNMTIEERKKLDIRKNTLWYMKKHIKEGKRIKVYSKVMDKIN